MGTADLYGSNDPFQRMPRSPRQLEPGPGMEELIVKVMIKMMVMIMMMVVKVDLANFSQISTGEEKEEAEVTKVKSPVAKSLSNKVGTGS